MATTWYPYDEGTVGATGPEGPAGATGPAGAPGVVQSVNGQSVAAVVLDADDVGALPNNANATLAASYMNLNRAAGNFRAYRWLTSGVSRWEAQVDDVAEAGSNAGSDFRLSARNDDGSFNKTVIHAKRSDGTISLGTTVHHGSAQVTSSGALGVRDIGADPATASGGTFIYSKGGKLFIKEGDGTSFQISQVSYPVLSVNGDTGNVTLGAADVGAFPMTGGLVNGSVKANGNAGTYRTLALSSAGSDRWYIQADDAIEPGDGTGSNLVLTARNDTGGFSKHVMYAKRGTGQTAFGVTVPLGDAQMTSNGAIGIRDLASDPANASGGIQLYSKAGLPYIKQADGSVFQVGSGGGSGGGAVDSVNGMTGIVTLDAASVGAIPKDQDVSTSGRLTSTKGFVVNSADVNANPIVTDSPEGQIARLAVMRTGGVDKLSLNAGGDLTIAGALTAGGTSTVPNLRVGSSGSFGGASGSIVAMANATTLPTSNPSGAILYVDAGVLKVRQADGTDVTVRNVSLDDLGGIPYTEKAATNGIASLDSSKRVPIAQLPELAAPQEFTPGSLGLKAWTSDPMNCISTGAFTGTTNARVAAVYLNTAQTITKIAWHFTGYAGGLLDNSWAAIYDSAGARKAYNNDIHTGVNEPAEQHGVGGGMSTIPVTSVTLQPGLYYIVWRFVYTTSPANGPMCLQYENSAGAPPNFFGTGNVKRFGVLDAGSQNTAYTTLPVSSIQNGANRFWAALA
ncbi:minor tail protein [Streptomyces phage Hank144]|uniref:Minor tail protein n=1 Tax=Streptomyces phage Hank144 TaxID=2301573 RepID=A0A385DR37_9CAUD|nr:minor tail protein [Streptomyces phage Hank144]AXQ61079.1 minor tail protein [Streptomyces phage Hank144]